MSEASFVYCAFSHLWLPALAGLRSQALRAQRPGSVPGPPLSAWACNAYMRKLDRACFKQSPCNEGHPFSLVSAARSSKMAQI